eukprot:scaffold22482_cov69-Phaeocystis_antarctica.AAC.12
MGAVAEASLQDARAARRSRSSAAPSPSLAVAAFLGCVQQAEGRPDVTDLRPADASISTQRAAGYFAGTRAACCGDWYLFRHTCNCNSVTVPFATRVVVVVWGRARVRARAGAGAEEG